MNRKEVDLLGTVSDYNSIWGGIFVINTTRIYKCISIILLLLLLCSACDGQSQPDDRDAFIHENFRIVSYEQVQEGLIVTAEDIDRDIKHFMVTGDTIIDRIPIAEKLHTGTVGLEVEIYAETWANAEDKVYFAKYINPSSNTDTKEEAELLYAMSYSNVTLMEKNNDGSITSCVAYSDGEAVNGLFQKTGLEMTDKRIDGDDWKYRITYYYSENVQNDKEIVCLIYEEGIVINNVCYDVELENGMNAFFDLWEPVFDNYNGKTTE